MTKPIMMPIKRKAVIRDQRCENCKWFHQNTPAPGNGECRRNPPYGHVVSMNGKPQAISCFPPVERDQWCGEHIMSLMQQN